ncbi:MAG: S8 family serine peptidase [Chloroflexaceae bacterium]|nr:S8 family serine peptidase [Chloroflexaceae bacterium]
MISRTFRVFVTLSLVVIGVGLLLNRGASTPAAAQGDLSLPAFRALVQATDRASWAEAAPLAPGAQVGALVQLEMPPLALVGHTWSHEERQQYLARLRAEQDQVAARVQALGGSVLARFGHAATGLAITIDTGAVAALRDLPGVEGVIQVKDYPVEHGVSDGDPLTLADLSALIRANKVRARHNDGTGIDIALIDTGVDYTHVKLGGSGKPADYRRAACGNAALTPGEPGCDPSLDPPADLFPNAKVRGGYDYVGDIWPNPDPRCGAVLICIFFDTNPIDLVGHGTHVADIAAGLPTSPHGADSGIAPGANLWAFKACNGDIGLCNGVALLRALDAALDLDGSDRGLCTPGVTPGCLAYDPADVINLSVSFSYGQPEDALTLFTDLASYYGSLVVAAAGNDGNRPYIVGTPAAADGALAVAESLAPDSGGERIAPSASRGPRIADNRAKPDLAAPGAILSARAGSGCDLAPFGGSSGSAPVAAGTAALMIQQFERLGMLSPNPGLADAPNVPLSLAPYVKTLLMNHGQSLLAAADAAPAPITLQGSGRLDALAAFRSRTLVWDTTELAERLAADPSLQGCTFTPLLDLLNYLFFRTLPPCGASYPFGDPLFRAWNAQTGSVSFGYQPVTTPQTLQRQVAVMNFSMSPRSYTLSTSLRGGGRGVSLSVTPEHFELGPQSTTVVTVTATIDPEHLRAWTLEDDADATCAAEPPPQECVGSAPLEVDGLLVVDGGKNNRVRMPIHLLPRRVAQVTVTGRERDRLELANLAPFAAGAVENFALVEISPNQCDLLDATTNSCTTRDYIIGSRPGSGESPVDLFGVGLRSYSVPGLNATLELPPAPPGAVPDEVVEFVLTVYDQPFRASPDVPVRFEVHIDADRNGATDYVVYNAAPDGRTGRNAVFVRTVGSAAPPRSYFFLVADFNTQNYILPVPAAAVGLRSDQPFNYFVLAYDAYFLSRGAPQLRDCSPAPAPTCGATAHTMQTGQLLFRPAVQELTIPPEGSATLTFSADPAGATGSPSQQGLLLIFRDSLPGQGSAAIDLREPGDKTVIFLPLVVR